MKHIFVSLSSDERSFLDNLIRRGSEKARVITHARILLLTDISCSKHKSNFEIAESLMTSVATVIRTRKRFIDGGIDLALYDKPRPGAMPKITGDIEAKITVLACSKPPQGHVRWTLRLLADKSVELGYVDSISHVAIGNRLKKTISNRGK